MKIPFDIKYKPQIESGEYKVETRDRRPVRIVSWDFLSEKPIIGLIGMGFNNGETIATYYKQGRVATSHDDCADLFIITPGPELSEFEKVCMRLYNEGCDDGLSGDKLSNESLKESASELLDLAREELFANDTVLKEYAETSRVQGKVEALKDLPRWRKCDKNTIYNTKFNLAENGVGRFLMVEGYQISVDSLEKLPGFNE